VIVAFAREFVEEDSGFTRRRDVTALGLDDHESNLVER
jgi:hypothetical protein